VVEKIGKFDVVVIGAGPGGYVAAIRAGQLGLKTAIVEKDPKPGGTCLHRGCIPTKALLETAHLIDFANEGAYFGVKIPSAELDLPGAMKFKQGVIDKNTKGVEFLLKKNKVERVHGTGRLDGPNQVRVVTPDGAEKVIDAANIVLATGSVPAKPGFLDFGDPRIITSDEVLSIEKLPKHITILGAGAVGTEFASIFRSFGCEVMLVEMMDRLLPVEDHECSAELLRAYKKRKIECRVATKLEKADTGGSRLKLTLGSESGGSEKVETDILLCAVGRRPVTSGLGLEKVGIQPDKAGFVAVNSDQSTSRSNIYAIGDIVGATPLLAHVASAEGIVAIERIAGMSPPPIRADRIPGATYCHPEVASVGLTENAAREAGHAVKVSKFPLSALGKSGILGKTVSGFFKIVADEKYGEILGIHIVGPHATDLICEGCAVLGLEGTAEDLAHIVHPHPTLGEGMLEAAHGLLGGAIHM
jgi:dihydrolipoamide dehydrogenase